MTVLDTNKPVWFDKEGGLLNEGYIYAGEPNKAPQDFPVTVTFEDSSGNQVTAAQPLRTDASGRIVYLGNPTIATVGEDYSLLILDSAEKQQDYMPLVDAGIITGSVDAKVYDTQAAAVADQTLVADMYVQTLDKTTPFDGDGADWRVVSYTGSPGDGIDLVDLDNGLQLKRLKNYLAANKLLEEIADQGDAAKQTARDNIGSISLSDVSETPVSGYVRSNSVYTRNNNGNAEVSTSTPATATVGKTGSGADFIMASLDDLPGNTAGVHIRVNVNLNAATDTGGPYSILWLFREGGAVYDYDYLRTDAATTGRNYQSVKDFWVPIDNPNSMIFKFNLGSVSGGTGSSVLRMTLIGYSTNW
jgi:hypothetical protein